MNYTLKKGIETASYIPDKIGEYRFLSKSSSSRVLLVKYFGDYETDVTISIYNDLETPVPKDLDSPPVQKEFENCIQTVLNTEKEGIYRDVELLRRQYYRCCKSEQPTFHCALFSYNKPFEKSMDVTIEEATLMFLRSDRGYFHKINFSSTSGDSGEDGPNVDGFIKEWMEYIYEI